MEGVVDAEGLDAGLGRVETASAENSEYSQSNAIQVSYIMMLCVLNTTAYELSSSARVRVDGDGGLGVLALQSVGHVHETGRLAISKVGANLDRYVQFLESSVEMGTISRVIETSSETQQTWRYLGLVEREPSSSTRILQATTRGLSVSVSRMRRCGSVRFSKTLKSSTMERAWGGGGGKIEIFMKKKAHNQL